MKLSTSALLLACAVAANAISLQPVIDLVARSLGDDGPVSEQDLFNQAVVISTAGGVFASDGSPGSIETINIQPGAYVQLQVNGTTSDISSILQSCQATNITANGVDIYMSNGTVFYELVNNTVPIQIDQATYQNATSFKIDLSGMAESMGDMFNKRGHNSVKQKRRVNF